MLENGSYFMWKEKTITLTDGDWQEGSEYVGLADYAFGDLNNDGIADAAISLSQNFGGSMWVETIFVLLNQGGKPVQAAELDLAEGTGRVSSMTIRRGQIILEESLHDWDDCNHCFSIRAVEVMQLLSDAQLVQRRLSTTHIPDQTRREIKIISPTEGTAVSCSVRLQGSISDYHDGDLLYYSIRSGTGEVLAFNSFRAGIIENPGATFELTIDVGMVPSGEIITANIYEADLELESPDPFIDGKVQYIDAMDSVVLTVV